MLIKKTKLVIVSFIITATFTASFYFADKALADDQQPILIQIYDTDLGTEAFEKLISYGNGGHQAIGDILGNAQNMETNPGIGFGIGSGGNGYRPSITIAVWTNAVFDQSIGLATIKAYFNVSSTPVTINGDCAISCDGTTQVEEVVTTTTTVASTTTLLEVVTPTQVSQSPQTTQPEPVQPQPQPLVYNTQPYIAPTTTTTTVVENVNVASAFVNPVLVEQLITPISKPKVIKPRVIKSNKVKKVLIIIK